jgi:hypothetical protein
LKVEFANSVDDFIHFRRSGRLVRLQKHRLARKRNPPIPRPEQFWLTRLGVTVFFGGLALSFASAFYLTFVASLLWLAAVIVIGAFLALMILIVLSSPSAESTRKWFEKDPAIALPISIEIADSGLHFTTAISRSVIEWRGILGVVDLPQAVVVLEIENLAHIIPRRAFANDEEIKAFVAEIESKTQVHHMVS